MRRRIRAIHVYNDLSYLIGFGMGIESFAFGVVYSWLGEYGCPADELKDALIGFGITLLVELIGLAMIRLRLLGLVEAEEAYREALSNNKKTETKENYIHVPYRTR